MLPTTAHGQGINQNCPAVKWDLATAKPLNRALIGASLEQFAAIGHPALVCCHTEGKIQGFTGELHRRDGAACDPNPSPPSWSLLSRDPLTEGCR